MLPLQSPKVTEGVAVGGSTSSQGALFGPDVLAGEAHVRVGLAETVEIAAEAMLAHIDEKSSADTHPNIYAGRIGLKWAPELTSRFLAFTAGAGGGGHAAGGYVSPDVGLVVGWENKYVVPFTSFEGSVSVPIAAKEVDTSGEDDDVGTHVDTPDTTWALRTTVGVRVPVTLGSGHAASFYLAGSSLKLVTESTTQDVDGEEGFGGLAGGFEMEF